MNSKIYASAVLLREIAHVFGRAHATTSALSAVRIRITLLRCLRFCGLELAPDSVRDLSISLSCFYGVSFLSTFVIALSYKNGRR